MSALFDTPTRALSAAERMRAVSPPRPERAEPAVLGLAATLRSIALDLDLLGARLELDPPVAERAEITVRVAALRVRLAAASGELMAATRGAR